MRRAELMVSSRDGFRSLSAEECLRWGLRQSATAAGVTIFFILHHFKSVFKISLIFDVLYFGADALSV